MSFLKSNGKKGKSPQPRGLFIFLSIVLVLGFIYSTIKNETDSDLRLEVTHVASGRLIMVMPIIEGEKFQIRYIHSVDRLPVYETFLVEEGNLLLDKVQWLSFGAGLGYTGQGEMILEDEWVAIVDMDRWIGSLFLRVGTVADHHLVYRGEEFPLKEYVAGMELVRFSIANKKK